MKTRVGMVSLGCPKNQVDAELMLARFKNAGFEITADAGVADVVVINTCGFIEDAKRESIENILEFCGLKKEGRIKCVAVTGCLAERYRDEVAKEIPEADVILGIGANNDIVQAVLTALNGRKVESFPDKLALPLSGERVLTTLPFFAYLKIAEGCDNCCSYCAIPAIRGPFRSRPIDEVVQEAEHLARNGITELVLVAQDTTRYGEDLYDKSMLPELLGQLNAIEGLKWIRVLYCYPERITDELIDAIANNSKVVKYLDIPIQHCDEAVLRAMNRRGSRRELTALIKKLRERIPGVTLRTTLIAGFPGETKQQFAELCDFVKEMKFDRLGCFAYSQEEDTVAAKMDGQLEEKEKHRRADIIMTEQATISERLTRKFIGKTVEAVVEGFDRYAECFFGRTAMDAPEIDGKIFFTAAGKLPIGRYVKVKIDGVMDYDLTGTVIEE
ncbi:30S ribosomal protein S12 methylthiotransferase RimO [Acetanaerobacterium elongatum]|nr:30S ribosomal protein S12 methylthiotransferase RimO [Acetanaerobacterium elongatum]